ncbi:mitochondrial DNA replication protein YHM2 [Martensiomyces pterosporus]|nr:mitochondrial DNA replication protein YHM2 [Martensiomyces pterosporus]
MSKAIETVQPAATSTPIQADIQKKPISWSNIALGAAIQTFEVSTLGQPFEVVKTHMAANRADSIATSLKKTYARGGIAGFYQGLIPWAWIESSTKGGVLLFTSSEVDYRARRAGFSSSWAGLFGGVAGGVAQAYTTMGFCTFMKTVEVTRHKSADASASTWRIAYDVFQREGIRGLNRGVSAVALRQMTNWGSRFGISRVTESIFRGKDTSRKLTTAERLASSAIGGALACWNQPLEVIRVEMQSQTKAADRPEKMNIFTTARYIYQKNGFLGFYRGVTPRVGLSVYLTVCMVFGGDSIKAYFSEKQKQKAANA